MKILISAFTYYPKSNGVQNVTEYQAEGLVKLGHDVTVITEKCKGCPDQEIHKGVNIIRINNHTDFMLDFGNKKQYQQMIIKASYNYDAIMTVCPESWCTDWVIPIIDDLHCACIMMVHGVHEYSWKKLGKTTLYGVARKIWGDIRWFPFYSINWGKIRRFDAIIQLHEEDFAYKWFNKHGIKHQYILYNAVDERFFDNQDTTKKNQIINVGTFCKRKNQKLCLDAFYKANIKNWNLVLIGTPKNDYYEELIQMKKRYDQEYGYKNVQILADVSREETINNIKESRLYLMTSITEFFPISLIEAMASGSAWISTDVGIVKSLPGGCVVEEEKKLPGAINKIINNGSIERLALKGRNYTQNNCRQATQVKKLEKIFEEAIENQKDIKR